MLESKRELSNVVQPQRPSDSGLLDSLVNASLSGRATLTLSDSAAPCQAWLTDFLRFEPLERCPDCGGNDVVCSCEAA